MEAVHVRWFARPLHERPPAGARCVGGRGARTALPSASRGSRGLCPDSGRAAMTGAASWARRGAATGHAGLGAAQGACQGSGAAPAAYRSRRLCPEGPPRGRAALRGCHSG
eukprot:8694527-Alexandrium_andersonii.AAC.1